jgi:hypothetical protein
VSLKPGPSTLITEGSGGERSHSFRPDKVVVPNGGAHHWPHDEADS